MKKNSQAESVLSAWITLSGIIKNSRITRGLMYNEAIVMNILYSRFCEDGEGIVPIKEIIQRTRMLKSLVNRTVNSLEKKGFLQRCHLAGDGRMVYVKFAKEKTEDFLKVHTSSISHAQNIIDIIGKEDAKAFVRLVDKIEKAGYNLS